MAELARIAVMSEELADQIAAGEVVERPAAVVKELIENALDAGATRVEVELEGGGMTAIRVLDDGRGIVPADLGLALRRHATSKLRRAEDLIEIATHGFRGEALASIAAVARVRLRSRAAGAGIGHELRTLPGEPPERAPPTPVGMPVGTHVEVEHLFASVPARRKFMRAEATEVAHCNEAVLRAALVHPGVHFTLRHDGRVLLDFARASLEARLEAVLGRRGHGSLHGVKGEHDGVVVQGWFADPAEANRSRHASFLVVRRRVVRERSLQQITRHAYGDAVPEGCHPVACLFVDPPRGTVDVNVHPQKTEVRFSDPQTVYAAVRRVLADGLVDAPWFTSKPGVEAGTARDTGEAWAASTGVHEPAPSSYRLGTRAAAGDYQTHKQDLKREVDTLRHHLGQVEGRGVTAVEAAEAGEGAGPELLTCLPGHVALFTDPTGTGVLAVDLLELRAHLVYRRIARDLGGEGVVAQGLLTPIVVACSADDVGLCAASAALLSSIGIELEPFGEGAVVVRAVPAHLRHCVDDADVGDLVARVLPWLRLRRRGADEELATRDRVLQTISHTRGSDPAPRLARRWMRELHEEGLLPDVPGVVRWTARRLVERERA